jgi:hypothetical protein
MAGPSQLPRDGHTTSLSVAARVNAGNSGNGLHVGQPALQVVAPPPVATDP